MKKTFLPMLLVVLTLTGCRATYEADLTDPAKAVESLAVTEEGQELTKEQAQEIVLGLAGFSADQVTRLKTEYEIDDGVALYEVTFYADGWEYDYEINAKTGELLSYDKDRD